MVKFTGCGFPAPGLNEFDFKPIFSVGGVDFNKPMLFAPKIAQGIGEAGLFGGTMIGPYGRYGKQQLVEFRRLHNQVQLIALNTDFVNTDDPIQRNVVRDNLNTAMAELDRVKGDIATGTTAISDIQEEARKANVPPGWLR